MILQSPNYYYQLLVSEEAPFRYQQQLPEQSRLTHMSYSNLPAVAVLSAFRSMVYISY